MVVGEMGLGAVVVKTMGKDNIDARKVQLEERLWLRKKGVEEGKFGVWR